MVQFSGCNCRRSGITKTCSGGGPQVSEPEVTQLYKLKDHEKKGSCKLVLGPDERGIVETIMRRILCVCVVSRPLNFAAAESLAENGCQKRNPDSRTPRSTTTLWMLLQIGGGPLLWVFFSKSPAYLESVSVQRVFGNFHFWVGSRSLAQCMPKTQGPSTNPKSRPGQAKVLPRKKTSLHSAKQT